jgi:hypothetical protein
MAYGKDVSPHLSAVPERASVPCELILHETRPTWPFAGLSLPTIEMRQHCGW